MRRFNGKCLLWAFVLSVACLCRGWGADFQLLEGTVITGEVSAFDDNGVVFRLKTGGFSQRVSWSKFTQEALKTLGENPRVKQYVEPFIEIPITAKPKPKPIVLKEVTRVERPVGRLTFFSSFTAPMGLFVLGLMYLGNVYAGFSIARFRNRPVPLVVGLSALLPLVGPLIFLASPTLEDVGGEAPPGDASLDVAPTPPPAAAPASGPAVVGVPQASAGGGLRVAAGHEKAGGKHEAKVYSRNEFTMNRRFIETQFAGFFRVVPSEAEKDLVLVIKTAKNEYLCKRISRISSNEMFLQLLQGGGTKEVSVSFGEIAQIVVRHKDDKPA